MPEATIRLSAAEEINIAFLFSNVLTLLLTGLGKILTEHHSTAQIATNVPSSTNKKA